MKIFWMIVAAVAIVMAGIFLWRRDFDTAFVIAALGMVAWFLNYRAQMKEITAAAELKEKNNGYEEEAYEDLDDK
ncbi:MAG TPA: hypothetical protein VE977_00215 [Pyrinomonadaceae bacterium]|nr:hypothetical protein [Pyrinomonadaceae bacterium]